MDHELTDLARWLRERATAVGCDPAERGSTAKLARLAGLDAGQVSRALRGESIPTPANAARLAAALRVPNDEMLRRILAQQQGITAVDESSAPAGDPDAALYEAAQLLGVPGEKRDDYVHLMKAMAILTRNPDDPGVDTMMRGPDGVTMIQIKAARNFRMHSPSEAPDAPAPADQ